MPRPSSAITAATVVSTVLFGVTVARAVSPPAGPEDPEARRYEAAVRAQVLAQRVGPGTVADLVLPETLLEQVVDDEIQSAFFRRYQVVSVDVPRPDRSVATPPASDATPPGIEVRIRDVDESLRALVATWAPVRPVSRGFRVPGPPGSGDPGEPWPELVPGPAADLVARSLARDGLLVTLAAVIDTLGHDRFVEPDATARARLAATGLPVDLLNHFRTSGGVIPRVARLVASGLSGPRLADRLAEIRFEPRPRDEQFCLADESGGGRLELLRLQLPRGTPWRAAGAGDTVDIVRQLVERLPDVPLLVALERDEVPPFLATAATWPTPPRATVSIIAEPFAVSRWAQDNGKAGWIVGPGNTAPVPATLLPRFASRRHDGSELVIGDSMVAGGLAAAGHHALCSPLLFQGGNMLAVVEPDGRRTLLLGEAEVVRNVALGLTREQVVAMFTRELDVDRCVVLPPASYHIDFEVTVRVTGDEVLAFVADTAAAQRHIIEAGVDALVRGGAMPAAEAATVRERLAAGDDRGVLARVGPRVYGRQADGAYPLSFAQLFETDDGDSGVGNLQRLLVALDRLVASTDPSPSPDPLARAYLRSIGRDAARRARLREVLAGLGWRVVPVPALVMGDRSICPLNGIHDRTRYVMPVYGGLFEPLDEAAVAVMTRALGPDVRIVPIRCGETQRRIGGVHCVASAFVR